MKEASFEESKQVALEVVRNVFNDKREETNLDFDTYAEYINYEAHTHISELYMKAQYEYLHSRQNGFSHHVAKNDAYLQVIQVMSVGIIVGHE